MGTSEMMTLTVWQMSQEHIPQRLSTSKTWQNTLLGWANRSPRPETAAVESCLAGKRSINSCSLTTAVQHMMVLVC